MTSFAALSRDAVRRRGWSVSSAVCMALCIVWLCGAPVGPVGVLWLTIGLLVLEAWLAVERVVLGWLGARPANRLEQERLAPLPAAGQRVLVLDLDTPFVMPAQRYVVVSRGALDLLEDRALLGLVTQASDRLWSATLAGELLVWLALLPLLAAWFVSLGLTVLGRALAVLVGWSLIVPMVLCPAAFVRWLGRVLGAALVGLFGLLCVACSWPAVAFMVWLAWLVVPLFKRLLTWEWCRAEVAADRATINAGLGWHLHEALETLALVDEFARPPGVLGLLIRGGAPVAARAERVWQAIRQS